VARSKNKKRQRKVVRPFIAETISVQVGRKKFSSSGKMPIFIDTGSSKTILPKEAISVLQMSVGPLKFGKKLSIMTANGPKIVQVLKGAKLCVGKCCIKDDILVTDNIPGALLVGSDFLDVTKAKVDYKDKTFTCGVRGKQKK
jgi:hypothetical protein